MALARAIIIKRQKEMFEDFPESERNNQYDLIFFSESFQYISMIKGFPVLKSLIKEKGKILICDFFKTVHHGDGGPGDKSMGGGHRLNEFYDMIKGSYKIIKDEDITVNVSPNLELMNDILMNRINPTIKYYIFFMSSVSEILKLMCCRYKIVWECGLRYYPPRVKLRRGRTLRKPLTPKCFMTGCYSAFIF